MSSNQINDSAERRLMAAVVLQAIQDLFTPENCRPNDRRDALSFLTASYGSHARDRVAICGNLEVDPDLLRDWAVGVLEGAAYDPNVMLSDGGAQGGSRYVERNQSKIAAAREMWAESKLAVSPDVLRQRREAAAQERKLWPRVAA